MDRASEHGRGRGNVSYLSYLVHFRRGAYIARINCALARVRNMAGPVLFLSVFLGPVKTGDEFVSPAIVEAGAGPGRDRQHRDGEGPARGRAGIPTANGTLRAPLGGVGRRV